MSPDHPTIRIGDAEREQLVTVLGQHMTAGRLDISEFESRLDAVYAARTRAQLDDVLTDLPTAKPPHPVAPPARFRPPTVAPWTPWALTGAICLLIWTATSLAQGGPLDFWPMWVIGPWGVVLLARAGTPWGRCGRA